MGKVPPNTVASLVWDVVADAAQFFNIFPTEEEFSSSSCAGMPESNLSVQRSMLSVNIHVPSIYTPNRWLTAFQPSSRVERVRPHNGGAASRRWQR